MSSLLRKNGKIMRSAGLVQRGDPATCPCCGGQCVCDADDTIALDTCCCLDPSDPDYCGDDAQRCEAPCLIPGGTCECGPGGSGVSVPACCCLPLTDPLSCASNVASCITPCDHKNGCTGCACCSSSCGTGLGAYHGSFSAVYRAYHTQSPCSNISDDVAVSVQCSGVRTGCGTYSGTCTFSGMWKEWTSGGSLKTHWETSYTAAFNGCAAEFTTSASNPWVVGPSPAGPRIFGVAFCSTLSADVCNLRKGGSGSSSPCNTCITSLVCTPPPCAGAVLGGGGMGACMSPGYAITPGGLLAPLRAIEMSRMIDPRRCPLCNRPGWDLIWRNADNLRGESATMARWKKGRNPSGTRSSERRGRNPTPGTPLPSTVRQERTSTPSPSRGAVAEMDRIMQQQMNAAMGHDPRRCGGCGQ